MQEAIILAMCTLLIVVGMSQYRKLYEPIPTIPNPMFSVGWVEDIDLSGGAAAIATILQQKPDFRSGTDDLKLPYDCYLKRLLYADETVGSTGAIITTDKPLMGNKATIWRENKIPVGDNTIIVEEWPGLGQLLPKGSVLSCTGAASGSGAEQHAAILHMHSPHFKPPMPLGNPLDPGGLFIDYGLLTGTLVAATLTGENDILAHIANYQDSEPGFGVNPQDRYTVYGLVNGPGGAGYGVCGLMHPSRQFYMLWPAVFASAVMAYECPLDQPWAFTGGYCEGPRLVGAGVGTTSTEFQPRFVCHGKLSPS